MPKRLAAIWLTRLGAFGFGWVLFGFVSFIVPQFIAATLFAFGVAGLMAYYLYIYLPRQSGKETCPTCGERVESDRLK